MVRVERGEGLFCKECSEHKCIDCKQTIFINPKYTAKCKPCKIQENKQIREVFKAENCVYLLHSKRLNIFKIGETNNIATRLSRIKYEAYPSDDWVIIDVFPYTNKKLLEKILHSRFSNFKIDNGYIDYFKDLHFMLEPKYFIKECRFCINFLLPYRKR